MQRARLRDLGISIGTMPTGQYNAITDVPGVRVGHCTVMYDEPRIARTGVTVVIPRADHIWDNHAFAGLSVLNGNGDMTGTQWIEESGMLTTPIAITPRLSLQEDSWLHRIESHTCLDTCGSI